MKCAFGMRYVEYLGHIVGDGKLAIPEHRASTMLEFKLPKTKKQLSHSWEECPTTGDLFHTMHHIPAYFLQLLLRRQKVL